MCTIDAERDNLDPRVQRTRRLLEDALVALLGEKPYAAISVKDLAARAGVNRATFYAHFVDKDDLAMYFHRTSFERMLREKVPDPPASASAFLTSLLRAVFEYMDWLEGRCRSAGRGNHTPVPEAQLQAQLQEIFLSGLKSILTNGRDHPVEPDVLALAISSAIVSVARTWSRRLERPPLEEVISQMHTVVSAAINAAVSHAGTGNACD